MNQVLCIQLSYGQCSEGIATFMALCIRGEIQITFSNPKGGGGGGGGGGGSQHRH